MAQLDESGLTEQQRELYHSSHDFTKLTDDLAQVMVKTEMTYHNIEAAVDIARCLVYGTSGGE